LLIWGVCGEVSGEWLVDAVSKGETGEVREKALLAEAQHRLPDSVQHRLQLRRDEDQRGAGDDADLAEAEPAPSQLDRSPRLVDHLAEHEDGLLGGDTGRQTARLPPQQPPGGHRQQFIDAVPERGGIEMDRVLAELETDQHAILFRFRPAGEPQRHERVPAAVQQPGRGALMLQKGEQLKLAEVRSQPGRASTLAQHLLHSAYIRLSQREARPPLVVLPVASDQR